MKDTSELSNTASRATWEERAVGGHRTKQNKGEKQYFHEIKLDQININGLIVKRHDATFMYFGS